MHSALLSGSAYEPAAQSLQVTPASGSPAKPDWQMLQSSEEVEVGVAVVEPVGQRSQSVVE